MRKIVIFATKFTFQIVKDQLEELCDKYAVIIQTPDVPEFLELTGDFNHVTVRDDRLLLDQDTIILLETIPQTKRSWYRQQYIKFKSIEYENDEFLILDGDTFLFNETIKNIFDTKCKLKVKEKYSVYNALIALIFPNLKLQNYSSVANCILVKPNIVKKGITDMNIFFQNVISKLNGDFTGTTMDLSEYQIINTLQSDSSLVQEFNLFRRADLLTKRLIFDPKKLKRKKYHGYCIEKNHDTALYKKFLAYIIYIFGYKYW
tara:strand:+ start:964 stop:1746 length:783 start_codon:yes stop_codon:yes gene_type:complete